MNFDITNQRKRQKKKSKKLNSDEKKIIFSSIFFLTLAIIFIIIYLTKLNNTPPKKKENPKLVPQETLKIVDINSNKRPLAVMIDNNIGDERHAGLQNSFVNYEIIVEGGLSRIMAIYKDEENTLIGPVRSSRHYFLDYALEYDAIYTHFGWSPKAEEDIKNLNVENINGMIDSTPFARDKNIPAPHNVFTAATKLREYSDAKGYSQTTNSWKVLNYSTKEINLNKKTKNTENLLVANKVTMTYSYNQTRSYIYDDNNKNYLRFMNGKEHIDRDTNNQLNYKNIIIMRVENNSMDSEDRQDLKTVGEGTGYYMTNGYALPINWTKESRTSKTKYRYEDGTEVKINDGNTFIQIVPISNDIVFE